MPYEDLEEPDLIDELDWSWTPNQRCILCSLEYYDGCGNCKGHQYCLPECPRCGGESEPIGGGEQ